MSDIYIQGKPKIKVKTGTHMINKPGKHETIKGLAVNEQTKNSLQRQGGTKQLK